MNQTNITNYWANFFGIAPTAFHQTGCRVLPHQHLAGFQGAWLYRRQDNIIFSVPPAEVPLILRLVEQRPPTVETLFTPSYIDYLFGERVNKIIGPAFQGFYQVAAGAVPSLSQTVERLDFEQHQEIIHRLSQSGDPLGWNHSGVYNHKSILYGYRHQGEIQTLANYRFLDENVGFIGVYTHPEFRGLGFGRATAQAALADLVRRGKTALYQTLHSNVASIAVAKSLGIQEFASHVAVRLKPKNGH